MAKSKTTFSIRVDKDTRRKLGQVATAEERSVGSVVRRAISADLENRARKALTA